MQQNLIIVPDIKRLLQFHHKRDKLLIQNLRGDTFQKHMEIDKLIVRQEIHQLKCQYLVLCFVEFWLPQSGFHVVHHGQVVNGLFKFLLISETAAKQSQRLKIFAFGWINKGKERKLQATDRSSETAKLNSLKRSQIGLRDF